VRRLALEQSLHRALERDELEVFYQPIFDRARRRIDSVEALVRWHHPTRGLVLPADFVTLAEDTGLIVPIGESILRTVTRQLKQWHDAGLTALRASVNISAPQFQQPNFVGSIAAALAENGLPAAALQLEMTESLAVQNIEMTMNVLRDLRALGVSIAIDDFGTGQSSLIYLKRFPIDVVKIDQAFIRDAPDDDSTAAIVSYVINLAHTLRLDVVAEGVETEEQYTFLRHYACDMMQGYLFAKPLPVDDVLPFLRQALLRPKTLEVKRPEV